MMDQALAAKAAYAKTEGRRWIATLEPEIAKLPKSTVVVINVATGEHEKGLTQREALKAYHARFGLETISWVHMIGGGIFVGGGIV